jgi:cytochrome c2
MAEPGDAHPVTRPNGRLALAHTFDDADDLMARYDRDLRVGQFAVDDMEIGATDCAGFNAYPDLARSRPRVGALLELERFADRCKNHGLHTSDAGKNKIGPSLFGVIGRKSGTVPGFAYSKAMKTANITWNDQTIGKYIADPKNAVPGNKMAYVGVKKEAERQEIVAYLNTLH